LSKLLNKGLREPFHYRLPCVRGLVARGLRQSIVCRGFRRCHYTIVPAPARYSFGELNIRTSCLYGRIKAIFVRLCRTKKVHGSSNGMRLNAGMVTGMYLADFWNCSMIYICPHNWSAMLSNLVLRIVHSVACRRVLAIRNLNTSAVVGSSRRLLAIPLLHDRRQDSPARMTGLLAKVWSGIRRGLKILVERSGVARVEEDRRVAAGRRVP
jgi:hypothetical protein